MCLKCHLFYFVLRGSNLYQRSYLCLSFRLWKLELGHIKVTPRSAGSRVSWESPQHLPGPICESMSWLSLCPEISVPGSTLQVPEQEEPFLLGQRWADSVSSAVFPRLSTIRGHQCFNLWLQGDNRACMFWLLFTICLGLEWELKWTCSGHAFCLFQVYHLLLHPPWLGTHSRKTGP